MTVLEASAPHPEVAKDALVGLAGPGLASHLDGCEVGGLTDFAVVEMMRGAQRLVSWAMARQLAAMAELDRRRIAQARARGSSTQLAGEAVVCEIASALVVTDAMAAIRAAVAWKLDGPLGSTREALLAGRIDFDKARVICDAITGLRPEMAALVEAAALEKAERLTVAQLRPLLRKLVSDADPEEAEDRKAKAVASRRVEVWPTGDGTMDLCGRDLPEADAQAAYNRINAIAAARQTDGDARPIDQIRADVFTDLLRSARPTPDPRDPLAPVINPPQHHESDLTAAPKPDQTTPNSAPPQTAADRVVASADTDSGRLRQREQTAKAQARTAKAQEQTAKARGQAAKAQEEVARARGEAAKARELAVRERRLGAREAELAARVERVAELERGLAAGIAGYARHGLDELVASMGGDGLVWDDGGVVEASRYRLVVAEAGRRMFGALAELKSAWCQTSVNPRGEVVHGRDGYRPSMTQRAQVQERDVRCLWPGCRRPASRCDVDHTVPYHRHGPTCSCNLQLLCRRHHRVKGSAGWKLIQLWPGIVLWISPTGHWRVAGPDVER